MKSPRPAARLRAEQLEDRSVPAALAAFTFVNDTWHLFQDVNVSGTVDAGDLVSNANDPGSGPITVYAYGTQAFGTVTSGSFTGPGSIAAFDSINEAIAGTDVGGTVTVLAGTYNETQVNITKALNVIGAGASVTTIDGGNATGLTSVGLVSIRANAANVTFSGFTLQNAGKTSGGVEAAMYTKDQSGGGAYTISNNTFLGSGTGFELGLYAYGHRGTLDFGFNTISGMNSNSILLERQFGASRVHDSIFAAGLDGSSAAYFNWA